MHEVVIIGAGAAGIASALEFADQGIKPLVLDVGNRTPENQPRAKGNLYRYRMEHDSFDLMIGDRYQGLANILTDRSMPVKLNAPNMEYVTKDARRLSPIDEDEFNVIQGFAAGGLANAWGAGLYRFTNQDLEGFPIQESDLAPFFDKLTEEIGISGKDDDLAPFFGPARNLQSPVRLSYNMEKIYRRYKSKKRHFEGELYIGHSRTGVLTRPKDGRPPIDYSNLEFWQELPSLYSPTITLNRLIEDRRVDYRNRILVQAFSEENGIVRVIGKNIDTGSTVSFEARKAVLAAGAVNTAKVVLKSFHDYETKLALLENPALQFPLVLPSSIGRRLDMEAFGLVQLNLIWKSRSFDALLQGSIMEITSPMRAEFFASLPFSAHANLALIRYLIPAMLVMQLFFPASCQPASTLSLQENDRLRIDGHPNSIDISKLKRLLTYLRRLGAWTLPSIVVRVPTGHAVHYAGTIPMRGNPKPYECNARGKLQNTNNIYIGDSASFPFLSAKNMSFAMMANAMRIAGHVANDLKNPGGRD